MVVVLNPPGIIWALENPFGPTGIRIAILADLVREKADANVNNEILDIRTGDLKGGLKAEVGTGPEGLQAVIGTDAIHRDFNYPAFLDSTGFPWLTGAMRDVFAGG